MTDGWAGPRPVLVGVGGLLLIAAGVVQLFVAALEVALFGPVNLIIAVPMSVLGGGAVLFGWRMRSGRDRVPAMGTAFLISIMAPLTLSILLATGTIMCTLVALVALIRHRGWFDTTPGDDPPDGADAGSAVEGTSSGG
jgi:hypothetical protein